MILGPVRTALLAAVGFVACCSASERPTAPGQTQRPGGTRDAATPTEEPPVNATAMKPALPSALEDELAAIRKDPGESVGFGEKAYIPYEPNSGAALMGSDDVKV